MTAQETAEAFTANTRPDSERCIRRDDRFIDRYLPSSGSYEARLTAAYAEGRKDEAEQRDIDAQRYRWLRNNAVHAGFDDETPSPWCVFGTGAEDPRPIAGQQLDAAIDAASLAEATERGKQIAAGLKLE